MTRQVTDNLYIDLEYFTPEEYYTYEALASANASASAELSVDIGVIKLGASTQSVTASITATISHIEGADLVLNNFATFDLVPSVIREVTTDIDSAFTAVAVTVAGNVQNASASFSAEFAQSVTVERIAGSASTQSSSSEFAADAVANRSAAIALDTIGNLNSQADRSRGYSSDLASAFTVTAESNPIIEFDAFLEYEIPDLFLDAEKTAQGVITAGALFTPSITAEVFKNHTAILETSTALVAAGNITASASSNQSSAFSQTANTIKLVEAVSTLSSAATLTTVGSRTTPANAALASTATLSASSQRVLRSIGDANYVNTGFGPVTISSTRSKFGGSSLQIGEKSTYTANGYSGNDGTNLVFGSAGKLVSKIVSNVVSVVDANIDTGSFLVYENSTWVTSQSNILYTSSNLSSWTSYTVSPAGYSITAIYNYTYNNSLHIIITNAGIFTSSNLSTWTFRNSVTSTISKFSKIGTTTVLLVGAGLRYSTNGTTWLTATDNTENQLRDITNNNNLFVMVGDVGTIVTDSDGIGTWTVQTSGTAEKLNDVHWDNSTFVAVGDNGAVVTSTNGTSWTVRTSSGQSFVAVNYQNGVWYAVTALGDVYSTTTFSSWTKQLDYTSTWSSYVEYPISDRFTTWKSIDMWVYAESYQGDNFTGEYPIIGYSASAAESLTANVSWFLALSYRTESAPDRLRPFMLAQDSSGNFYTAQGDDSAARMNINQWNHIRLVTDGSLLSIYLNGTRTTISGGFNRAWSSSYKNVSGKFLLGATGTQIYRGYNRGNLYIDELLITDQQLNSLSATTITIPTAPWTNNTSIDALLHFDNNLFDDAATTDRFGAGALSSAVTVSALAGKVASAGSTQSAQATLTSTGTRTRDINANLAANGFVVTVAGFLQDDVADLIYSIDMSVSGNIIANGGSTQSSTAIVSAAGGLLKSADSNIASESALSASLGTIRTTTVTINSAVTATADAERLRGINADLVSEGFVLAIGGEQQDVTANLASTAELSAVIGVVKQFNSTQSVTASLTANSGFVSSADADIAAESSITVNNFRVRFADIAASSEFSQTADINFVADHSTAISTSSELQAQGNLIRDHAALFNAAVSLQAQGNYTLSSAASADANADLQAVNNYTASGSAEFESVGFAISVVAKTGLGAADLTAVSTMSVQGNAILEHSASVTSSSAMTTTGTRIFEFAIGSYNVQGVDFRSGFSPFLRGTTAAGNYGAWVMSFYAADAQGTLFDGDAFTNEPTGYSDKSTITISNSALRYEVPYDGYVEWDISELDLSGYHHYLLRVNTAESTNSLKYQLFIDGEQVTGVTVYKTNTSEPSPPNYQIVTAPTDFPIELASDINLGVNTWNRSSGEGVDFSKFSGGFTQWYFDYTNSYTAGTYPTQNTLYREQFFDGGYVDMGADGRDSGLSEPRHFLELLDYTSTTNISDQGSSNSNWRWKTLFDNPTIVGSDVIDYTASVTDNSTQAILGPVRGKFSLTATGRNIQVVSAQMPAVFTQVTRARKTVQGNISLNSAVSTQVQASSTKRFDTQIQSTATLAANTSNTVLATANLVSTANLTADGDIESGAIADFNSNFTLAANAGLLAENTATIASESSLSVQADKIKDAFLAVDSACAVQATAIKTASAQGTLANTATLTVIIDRIPAFRIDLESNFAVTTSAVKTTDTGSTQTAQSALSVTPRKLVGVSADFSAFYSQLTVGRVISLDPYTTYIVPAESRLYKIHRETRLYTVEPENRLYKIRKESRLYTIDSETRIYNIKG